MTCHFCGSDRWENCGCTATCKHCPHIGHEHYSDGQCRGHNYYTGVDEPCEPHTFER